MSVSNGQFATETTFNTAFLSRTQDTSAAGVISLLNSINPNSGAHVTNLQRAVNEIFDSVGMTGEADATRNNYSSNNVVTNGDDRKEAIGKLDAKFHESTGHTHSGAAGDAPPIAASDIADVPLKAYILQGVDLSSVTGGSVDVSTELTGKTKSGGDTSLGVVASFPNNKILLRDLDGPEGNDSFEDDEGRQVFGRLTESAGVWTITFFVNNDGTEDAYSFSGSVDIRWYYQELFNPLDNPPVYNEFFNIPSDNATADVVDASSTQRGLVNTTAQSFAGEKTFTDDLILESGVETARENVATATDINALSTSGSFVKLTGSTATNLNGAVAGGDGRRLTIHNGSSALITVVHESGSASAANRFDLPGDTDIEINPGESVGFIYDTESSRWVPSSGSGGGSGGGLLEATGSSGTPEAITTSGIAFTGDAPRQIWYVEGDGGHVNVTADPQIDAGTVPNQELLLVGCNDAQTITLEDGDGLDLNGDWVGGLNSKLMLVWDADASVWSENWRRS